MELTIPQSGLNLASMLSGITMSVITVTGAALIYGDVLRGLSSPFPSGLLIAISFITGFLIQSIRYYGLQYYIYVYNMAQPGRGADKKYPGLWQRFIFYIFRNGTAIEECANSVEEKYNADKITNDAARKKLFKKKAHYVFYPWIQESYKKNRRPEKDLWLYADSIQSRYPQRKIETFYYWSEVCQCLDTAFLLLCAASGIAVAVNILIKICLGMNFSAVIPALFAAASLLLHRVSKGAAKSNAKRFFYHIQLAIDADPSLTGIPETNKTKE
jgi:hypothetical protein